PDPNLGEVWNRWTVRRKILGKRQQERSRFIAKDHGDVSANDGSRCVGTGCYNLLECPIRHPSRIAQLACARVVIDKVWRVKKLGRVVPVMKPKVIFKDTAGVPSK